MTHQRPTLIACLTALALLAVLPAASYAAVPRSDSRALRPVQPLATIAVPPQNPGHNLTLSALTTIVCTGAPSGATCTDAVLAAIDAARAGEGVRPMRLPGDYPTLNAAQQLLVVSNLERIDRGLAPAAGLSGSLDRRAWVGARSGNDPALAPLYGNAAGSNWAGGDRSVLEADFAWMYDDGPGSHNIECAAPGQQGCWGHRDNILAPYHEPVAMGAAVVGSSEAELFVGSDTQTGPNQPDALVAPMYAALMRRH
ncbi:MAG: hypothetical protein ACLP50_21280 [Solirubrobacteraceae bacterium]